MASHQNGLVIDCGDNDPENTSQGLEDNNAADSNPYIRAPLFPLWTRLTQAIHNGLTVVVTACATTAARRPWQTIGALTALSVGLLAAGFASGGFRMELDIMAIFNPIGSRPQAHYDWIQQEYNSTRKILLFFHNDGHNVLHAAQARRVVEAVDVVRSTSGLEELCARGSYIDFEDKRTCRIWSVSGYWKDHSLQEFDATVRSDQDVRLRLAHNEFASGAPIFHDAVLGNWEKEPLVDTYDNSTTVDQYVMASAQSYFVRLDVPDLGEEADLFEEALVERIVQLRATWAEEDAAKPVGDPTLLSMDFNSVYAYQMEGMKLIFRDLYLVAVAAMVVVVFTCMVFYRHDADKAASRTLLGVASIITITMSLMAGFGVMFLFGVPFTTCTQMLPYVIYGIGLDDTFIITGAFFQIQDTQASVEKRIEQAMKAVGWSICLTTITTITAFVLGYASSSFNGVRWLCLYAAVVIAIDFVFQISFFVAFLVLDERRIEANRRDGLLCCFTRKHSSSGQDGEDSDGEDSAKEQNSHQSSKQGSSTGDLESDSGEVNSIVDSVTDSRHMSVQERAMKWYAKNLMRPWVKVAVLVLFAALFAVCFYSATLLEQAFNMNDYVADDSYLKNLYANVDAYSSIVRPIHVHFRDVDQADPDVQQQMRDYVSDLETLDQIGTSAVSLANLTESGEVRPFCWVRDFQEWEKSQYADDPFIQAVIQNMTFMEKLNFALTDRRVREVFGTDIVRDPETGDIVASRCTLFLRNLDINSIPDQVELLLDQREVTMAQPINKDRSDWAFFSFDVMYFLWESSSVVIDEMIFTTIAGVVAVSLVAFVFVPHWTACFFVIPLIFILYIDLLGLIQFFGLYINPLTYVCVVVSIGLLVDFLIHILLRYYEATPGKTRDGRVQETLETMGVSILVGGLTTFLAAVPLAFSSAEIFKTVFYCFFSMVSLGVTHGLILLPVLLSYLGPTVSVLGHHIAYDPDALRHHDGEVGEKDNDSDPPAVTPQTQASEAAFLTIPQGSSLCEGELIDGNMLVLSIPHDSSTGQGIEQHVITETH